jgi:predicted ABC-type ATPase
MPKLIILRGPSGAGKSTVVQLLRQCVPRNTAFFEQDYFRHTLYNSPDDDKEAPRHVMFAGVRAALLHGNDVVIEGIVSVRKYKTYFTELFASRIADEIHIFYMDVGFDETVRRHAGRAKAEHFGESQMRDWYERAVADHYDNEVILPQRLSAQEICAEIMRSTKIGKGERM